MSGFNSKEFGNKLNISRTTIGRFESGEMLPNAQIIKELCGILGVYSTELF